MVANTRVELSIEGGPPRLACKSFEHERRFEMGSTMTVRYARSSCNLTFDVGMCLPACLSLSVIVFRGYDTPQDPTLTLCSRFSQTVDLPFISRATAQAVRPHLLSRVLLQDHQAATCIYWSTYARPLCCNDTDCLFVWQSVMRALTEVPRGMSRSKCPEADPNSSSERCLCANACPRCGLSLLSFSGCSIRLVMLC